MYGLRSAWDLLSSEADERRSAGYFLGGWFPRPPITAYTAEAGTLKRPTFSGPVQPLAESLDMDTVRELISLRVLLDNLLIATLLFFSYRTLRRLGTWKIVTGILLAMGVFIVANIFDFRGVRWIYTNVSHVAVIGFIVLFQPEIRKMFERAASLRRVEVSRGGNDLAGLVGDVAFSLAQLRRGGILVFPGKEPIQEWTSGGFPLNAVPSYPLFMSIFDPHSAGHDGAAIVENGRFLSFGVRLPVSRTNAVPDKFGTRHHAGMGLSEVCDAFVVVISEERGIVTAFYHGKMIPVPNRDILKARLIAHWKNVSSYTHPVYEEGRRWVLVHQFMFSLLVAFVFWYTVIHAQGEVREKGLTVPIEYVATPQHVMLVGDRPTEIKIHVAGPKSELDELDPSRLSVKIDLSNTAAGDKSFIITDDLIKLPKKVKLLDAKPAALALHFKEIVETEVPIKPQIVGRLPQGLRIISVDVNPERLKILSPGPERKPGDIALTTTPIYLENLRESTSLLCKIIAPPTVQPLERRWPDVEVRITIGSE